MSTAKIIAVVGPTASGKTSLGIFLAQKIGGEVISADSRQVYKGLNIGTGKVTKKEMLGVSHHLLDVANPKKVFTAEDYVKLGRNAIEKIVGKNHTPIVVGGTGFYIDALLGRITLANVPPNKALRKKLKTKTVAQLYALLLKKDPERAKTIDAKNPVRLIRAIEIAVARSTGAPSAKPLTSTGSATGLAEETPTLSNIEVLYIGINPDKATLQKNIHTRLLARLKAGMLTEAKRLHKTGISYKRMEELGLEYRYMARLLQKRISQKEFMEQLEREINHYAKRQLTWFKRNKEIVWVKNKSEALRLAKEFLS